MGVRDTLQSDLKASLKQGDKVKSGVIRFIMSNVHNAEIAQRRLHPGVSGKPGSE